MLAQVLLSGGEPLHLEKLRDAIHQSITGSARRPLAPRDPNVPRGPSVLGKRKADSMGAPSVSGASGISCSSLGATATSGSAAHRKQEVLEELAPLSVEQQSIADRVVAGHSVFFTGCAGTGKSLLLKHILRALPQATTYVTASTGLAASVLGGTTLNAFAGIGRASDLESMTKMASRPDAAQRWRRATTLIIDEISMVDATLFEHLEAVARHVRRSKAPFGGIQLVLTGDFHQLPPVAKGAAAMAARRFAFESECWASCVSSCMQLKKVFRQADRDFIDILARMRSGACTSQDLRELEAGCSRSLDLSDGILPTMLFTHCEDVEAVNAQRLAELPGDSVRFAAQDTGRTEALQACQSKASLELKAGAQVMLTRNVAPGRGLVNGARGIVQRFCGTSIRLPVVLFANGLETTVGKERWTIRSGTAVVATRTQVPLALGWALSVHKSQGMTLDRVEVNLAKAFEAGMAYVALSRARSLKGLRISGIINARSLRADPKVLAFYATLGSRR
ncbi:g2943 [Coccomyxa viridis]|uniref:ATP-dependent DNA helicase n=1 Tax=Coccomyxa viridis TaxID=1274662 RepID=A0ABP1FRT5_9CHLO